MSRPHSDPDLEAALPVAPLDDLAAERIRRSAQAALDEERVREGRRAAPWERFGLPAVVAVSMALQLSWAVQAACALYR